MKVALVVDRFPTPSETFIRTEVEGLRARGCEIEVYADRESRRMRRLLSPFRLARHCLGNAIGVKDAVRIVNRYGERAFRAAMFEPCDRPVRYDVIHAHFGPNGLKAAAMRELGLIEGPLMVSFHGYDMRSRDGRVPSRYQELFRQGARFLPVSQFFADRLRAWGCPADRITVHPMGVVTDRFQPRDRPAGSPLRLVSVARLVPKKGLEYAIRAVATMQEPVEYHIAGDGPLRHQLSGLIRKLGVGGRVTLLGWLPEDQIADNLRWADVFVAPSVTAPDGDEEGIPVSIMEAMAIGLPVVATRHAGIPELVEHQRHGHLVAERNVAELSAALSGLSRRPERRIAMGLAARDQVAQRFESRVLVEQLMDLYHAAAGVGAEATAR